MADRDTDNMPEDKPLVGEYMVRNVQTVDPNMTVKQAIDQITRSEFHGFPVAENGYLLGFVTAKELLRFIDRPNAKIRNVMKRGTFCAVPSMTISDATRILFRYGLRNLPVIDDDRKLIGIISNLVTVKVDGPVAQNEICFIELGGVRLMAEVIKVTGDIASVQVYESTRGLQPG